MDHRSIILPWEILYQYLNAIKNIRFTYKEIDIIACILSGKSSKSIAQILNISPKTVDTHILNIMRRLKVNDRASIVKIIEKTEQFSLFNSHYLYILNLFNFKNFLEKLRANSRFNNFECSIHLSGTNKDFIKYVHNISQNLKDINIKTIVINSKNQEYLRYIHNKDIQSETAILKITNILFPQDKIKEISLVSYIEKDLDNIISIANYNNYYEVFIKLLNNILDDTEGVISFEPQYICNIEKKIISHKNEILKLLNPQKEIKIQSYLNFSVTKKHFIRLFFFTCLFLLITCISWYFTNFEYQSLLNNKIVHKFTQIRSDLIIPIETALLRRPYLIREIDRALNSIKGIKTVALVGVGGSGKTILSRQYAFNDHSSIVWELNAENQETLYYSFEQLAYALATSTHDKQKIRDLKNLNNDFSHKKKEILSYIKAKLKESSGWLLIYDNVTKIQIIHEFFPHDIRNWGQGKVIITTQDSNIIHNNYINKIIRVNELTSTEKIDLFSKITQKKILLDNSKLGVVNKFLQNLPSYPLDVSVAAYYMKVTGITYNEYLNLISKSSQNFLDIQQTILKDISDYTKTRGSIIALSLNKIISADRRFVDILLFICLLNSQDIPIDLLKTHCSGRVIDNFIIIMKKYSLITSKVLSINSENSFISMNPGTQKIILNYLKNNYLTRNDESIISNICICLEDFLIKLSEEESLPTINLLKGHYETFLSHIDILNKEVIAYLNYDLMYIYFLLGCYKKAIDFGAQEIRLEEALKNSRVARMFVYLSDFYGTAEGYKKAKRVLQYKLIGYEKNNHQHNFLQVLSSLGFICLMLGQPHEAKQYFEEGLEVCLKNSSNNYNEIAKNLIYLGVVYRDQGNYTWAKRYLEESLQYLNKSNVKNYIGIARAQTYLGTVYECLGEFEKAKLLISESIELYKKHLPEHAVKIAWSNVYLAKVYAGLSNYKTAERIYLESLKVYETILPENHIFITWLKLYLGQAYGELGEFEKAENLLRDVVYSYEKFYGKYHNDTLQAYCYLSNVYYLAGRLADAENISKNTLKLFTDKKHSKCLMCLKNLQKIYAFKLHGFKMNISNLEKTNLMRQLKQSFQGTQIIIEKNYPQDSPIFLQLLDQIKVSQYE